MEINKHVEILERAVRAQAALITVNFQYFSPKIRDDWSIYNRLLESMNAVIAELDAAKDDEGR